MQEPWLTPFLDRMEEMSRRFFRYFHSRIEEEGGLSPSQFFVLKVLAEGGTLTVSDLAARLGMSAAGATGLVDRLVKADLVERSRDESDRRIVWVGLSAAGRERLDAARLLRRSVMAEILGPLTPAEVEQLVSLYEKAFSRLQAPRSDSSSKE